MYFVFYLCYLEAQRYLFLKISHSYLALLIQRGLALAAILLLERIVAVVLLASVSLVYGALVAGLALAASTGMMQFLWRVKKQVVVREKS